MKLIIWDFDGTLVDSRPPIEAGMAHTLDALGLHRIHMQTWLSFVGLPLEDGLRNTFGPLGLDHDKVVKAYRSFPHADHEHLIQPFEGIQELLEELGARGQRMAIVTSKRRIPLLRQMAQWGWEPLFDPIITPDEVQRGKPHPESLERLRSITGLAARDVLMVGDTPFDLDMARVAGVPSLAIGHGFYAQEALAACGPRAYAPDTAALRDILLAWSEPWLD